MLAQSAFPMPSGNAAGQHVSPFCQRKGSNCALAPNNDTTAPLALVPGVMRKEVVYEVFSLQNGSLVDMGNSSQVLQTKIAAVESNPTNPNQRICDWNTPATRCVSPNSVDLPGWYTDDYDVGDGAPNTCTQVFAVDRGQVQVYWPTDVTSGKIWCGAWEQKVTTSATTGGVIQQTNPNTQNGATCNLHPPDQTGCSPTQANGTN
jgi:hypothetical protein